MKHVRQQIREHVADLLDGTPGVNGIFPGRVYSVPAESLPAVSVYLRQETLDAEQQAMDADGRVYMRECSMVVELMAQATDGIDDLTDTVAAEIEKRLASDTTLGGLAIDSAYTGMEQEVNAEGDQPIGVARLTYAVLYQTSASAPDQAG